eukprot:scaffold909_cov135-Cylindrotheca_fusiformis.AAC.22
MLHSISHSFLLLIILAEAALVSVSAQEDTNEVSYGIDVSFPIHGRVVENNPLGDRRELYRKHLEGCRKHFETVGGPFSCDQFEYDRLIMNRRQPQSMVNLTETGFTKIQAPPKLKELIDEFWANNKDKAKTEAWHSGNSYVNHWNSPTTLVSVDDKGLRGSGARLKENIWAAASALLEEWTQVELQPCSLYGIRVYHEGAIMLPHVDRLPLVASAVINVAQDVEEDWPTEVYDHQGNAHNVSLQPGEMLLFESHSVMHGKKRMLLRRHIPYGVDSSIVCGIGHPFPLKGKYAASIFIHFEPTGHTLGKNETGYFYVKDTEHHNIRHDSHKGVSDLNKKYHDDVKQGFGGQSAAMSEGLPPYINRASPEEENWLRFHPEGWEPPAKILPPEAHIAAKTGQLEELKRQLKESKAEILTQRDENGWQVLHQAVAGGFQEAIKLLVDNGAEINARTHGGYGESPLRIAEREYGPDSPICHFLKGFGALSIGPEL